MNVTQESFCCRYSLFLQEPQENHILTSFLPANLLEGDEFFDAALTLSLSALMFLSV